jgi:Zn finger protein HypA/HybF involved in hydrogenase expression
MHELSIALEICRIAEGHVGPDRLSDLREIGVELGDDAGVEFASLVFCLDTLLGQPPFGRARAIFERSAGDTLRVSYLEVDDDGAPH